MLSLLRRPNRPRLVEPSRLRLRDLLAEALAGVLQRPARSSLTVLGTVLGVGAFTAILGLTASAGGQISKEFTVLAATQVTVRDVGTTRENNTESTIYDFPADADDIVGRLNGVTNAGVRWPVFRATPDVSAQIYPGAAAAQLDVYAASPGYLRATDPTLKSGVLFNAFHDSRTMRVAVLGSAAAGRLGISNLAVQPAVFINGTAFTVVGILDTVQRDPADLLAVLIPDRTALALYGKPSTDNPASMLIETRLGAAQLLAHQAPQALRPDNPAILQAAPPPDPHTLKDTVTHNVDTLFLLLAAITLVIGAVGIANTTLVAVMERVGEIGLRRTLGARPRHIAGQFLAETTLLGMVGGLVGTSIGIVAVVIVALAQHWTAILDPASTLCAPLIGAVTGLLAGGYPAMRAARIEPVEALRR